MGTSTYDGSLALAVTVSGSSTTTGSTTTANATLVYAYNGGPLTIAGEHPLQATFHNLSVTTSISVAVVQGGVGGGSVKVKETINGSATVNGQPVAYNNETFTIDTQ